MDALVAELKTILIESLNLEDIRPDDIDPAAALFVEGLGLDSIDALELGLALQKRYGVTMPADPQQARAHFASLDALAAFVAAERKR
jgi:acyl carrier protein